MVSIFQKKIFVVDLLEDFVDIHNHILPGIDDGAKNIQDSLDILTAFKEIGIKRFICTPHIFKDLYPNDLDTIRRAHLSLLDVIAEHRNLDVRLDFAAEHMIDEHLEQLLLAGEFLPLGKSYILIEMPFMQASLNLSRVLQLCMECKVYPILAHPERYRYLHHSMDLYRRYRDMGVFYQVNLLSLAGYYGNKIQAKSLELIQEGMVDFFGTDVHKAGEIERIKSCQIPKKLQSQFEKAYDLNLESFHI